MKHITELIVCQKKKIPVEFLSKKSDFSVTDVLAHHHDTISQCLYSFTSNDFTITSTWFLINCRHLKSRFSDRFHEECESETLDLGRSVIGASWGVASRRVPGIWTHRTMLDSYRTKHNQTLHLYMYVCAYPACARVIIE